MQLDPPVEHSNRQQVRNLLLVLASAVISGCLIVGAMIHYWGPAGDYVLHDLLLAPDVLPQLSYSESGSNTRGASRLVFDRIEYRHFHDAQRQWRVVDVPLHVYQKFYDQIKFDRSILGPHDDLATHFDSTQNPRLTIWVKSTGDAPMERRVIQELSFSKERLYRVAMMGQPGGRWIYFEHPNLQSAASALMVPPP